jgi:hypothetical protein
MDAKAQENCFFKMIPTEDGEIPFLRDIWGFFGSKGIKTQFFSINPDKSYRLDIEICESLGCPIRILTNKEEVEAKWEVVKNTLKNRKLAEEDKEKAWLQGMEKKWILPKNVLVKRTDFAWNTLRDEVAALTENRCDLLKIEGVNDVERVILYSALDTGFRPGIVLIRYTEDPDANVPSMLVAGHLQMAGYKLLEVSNNWFLYVYNDMCLYDSCSWRNTKVQNPIVHYLAEMFAEKEKERNTLQQPKQSAEENKQSE